VIIGIGVNIAQRSFPEEISDLATSLFLENSRLIEPEDFARPMLARLEDCYSVATSKPQEVITRWEELSSFARGLPVAVQSSEGVIEGVTRGLTPKGALILELDSGESREIVAGEVNLRATNASS
jgi:BirA family biotin operon repressor/biotin-[acetyl-CoA-carboxylase] ligase